VSVKCSRTFPSVHRMPRVCARVRVTGLPPNPVGCARSSCGRRGRASIASVSEQRSGSVVPFLTSRSLPKRGKRGNEKDGENTGTGP
jgi:hypothetical protein